MKKQFLNSLFTTALIVSLASCGSDKSHKQCLSGDCQSQKIESLKAEDIKLNEINKNDKSSENKGKKTTKGKKRSVNRLK